MLKQTLAECELGVQAKFIRLMQIQNWPCGKRAQHMYTSDCPSSRHPEVIQLSFSLPLSISASLTHSLFASFCCDCNFFLLDFLTCMTFLFHSLFGYFYHIFPQRNLCCLLISRGSKSASKYLDAIKQSVFGVRKI